MDRRLEQHVRSREREMLKELTVLVLDSIPTLRHAAHVYHPRSVVGAKPTEMACLSEGLAARDLEPS